jgi:hypothetical protein
MKDGFQSSKIMLIETPATEIELLEIQDYMGLQMMQRYRSALYFWNLDTETNYPNVRCRFIKRFFFFLVAPTLGSLLRLLEHRAEFPQFLDQVQLVGLLGRVISSSQGL